MSCVFRTCFAAIATLMGLSCIGYAFYLTQADASSSRRAESPMAVAGVIAFGLSGGLCILATAVAMNGPRGRSVG